MRFNTLIVSAVCSLSLTSGIAAQDASDFSLDGYIGLTTDYRDRGLSLSDRDIAVVGSIGAFHENGFYFGLDAGTVSTANGADGRIEFYTGYSLDKGGFIYDFSVEVDSFHGSSSQFYPEFKVSASRDFGLAFTRAGVAYAPEGRWINPNNDSFYTFADLEIPVPNLPALTFVSHVGHDFRGGLNDLWDWSVGLSAFVDDVEFSLSYENSSLDRREGSGRVIFGARLFF